MENYSISAQGIQLGKTMYHAEYSKAPSGSVFAFTRLGDEAVRVEFKPDNPEYPAALAAWEESYQGQPAAQESAPETQPAQEEPEEFSSEWWEEAQEATPGAQEDAAPEAQDATPEATPAQAKTAPQGETLEKIWVGTSIKGKGWEIYFDGAYMRTRVIFKRKPSDAVRQAVKDAGFFWCPAMKSWNKKLTWKAYRAAQDLEKTLWKLCA